MPQVNQDYADRVPIIRIYRPRRVDHRQPLAERQAAPGADLALIAIRQGDLNAG